MKPWNNNLTVNIPQIRNILPKIAPHIVCGIGDVMWNNWNANYFRMCQKDTTKKKKDCQWPWLPTVIHAENKKNEKQIIEKKS